MNKKGCWITIIIVFFFLAVIGKCGDDDELSSSSNPSVEQSDNQNNDDSQSADDDYDSSSQMPGWLIGRWQGMTPMGVMTFDIMNDHTIIDYTSGESEEGTFEDRDGEILAKFPNTGGAITRYEVDLQNHQINLEQGCVATKQ